MGKGKGPRNHRVSTFTTQFDGGKKSTIDPSYVKAAAEFGCRIDKMGGKSGHEFVKGVTRNGEEFNFPAKGVAAFKRTLQGLNS